MDINNFQWARDIKENIFRVTPVPSLVSLSFENKFDKHFLKLLVEIKVFNKYVDEPNNMHFATTTSTRGQTQQNVIN